MRTLWRVRGSNPALLRARRLRAVLLVAFACLGIAAAFPHAALAIGPNAVMYPAGWNTNSVARGDDTANLVVGLPFTMNWMGNNYTQLYLNMNGNVTFSSGFTSYTPGALTGVGQGIMAPYWADVDTRYVGSPNLLYYSNLTSGSVPTVNGHKAVLITWSNVMRYNGATQSSDTTDTFQLVIIDRSDTGAGNFDFMYNYDKMVWDMGTASNTHARAGWAVNGTTSYELPGSGSNGGLLDSGAAGTSLIQNSLNSGGQLGRYVWQVRGAAPPNIPPQVTVVNRVLEGNALNSYTGYTGVGDGTATDPDGSIVSFTNDLPSPLVLGTTNVTWTATDNMGAVTSAVQSILVTDTTPASTPTLTSPTHVPGVWTTANTVTVNSANATDVCTGVHGASYSWSQNATSAPDTVLDASTIATVTTITTTTIDSETFATAAWPADMTRSDATYIRLTNAAGRNHGTYAAELWANNGTRRTANFYRDYDLTGFGSANLTFWDNVSALAGGGDYARVEYSTDGGTTYTQLQNLTAVSAWTQRSYSLPVGGVVRVRFSGSVNAATEYADWDDISVTGYTPLTYASLSTSTTSTLSDGMWYFNIRTVDNAGNWSATTSMGPFDIDTTKPTTTDNAPAGWSKMSVSVSLTATDVGPVAWTKYRLNGGAVTTYTAPVVVSAEGTNTLQYWSQDQVGNSETTHAATIRIDTIAPTIPGSPWASTADSRSVDVTWTPSADLTSGLAYYNVYRNGSLIGTTAATLYNDSSVVASTTYSYYIRALDAAGNISAASATVTETVPAAGVYMTIATMTVDFGSINPGTAATVTNATMVSVGSVGDMLYDLSCQSTDFTNLATASPTPTMTVGAMSFATSGYKTVASQPFSTSSVVIDTLAPGQRYRWQHDYAFAFTLTPPWSINPGTYNSTIVYTVVLR